MVRCRSDSVNTARCSAVELLCLPTAGIERVLIKKIITKIKNKHWDRKLSPIVACNDYKIIWMKLFTFNPLTNTSGGVDDTQDYQERMPSPEFTEQPFKSIYCPGVGLSYKRCCVVLQFAWYFLKFSLFFKIFGMGHWLKWYFGMGHWLA